MLDHSLNFWHLFWQASLVVKLVMLILCSASIFSWAIIWQRAKYFKTMMRNMADFERDFWSADDLSRFYQHLNRQRNEEPLLGMARIFCRGFKEFVRLNNHSIANPEVVLDGVSKIMDSEARQIGEDAEVNLSRLGTIASVSPYVGLFGTVWGIMHSFIALGGVEQATLSMVAPGIAESLIATALGLLVAIPATIAYNRYLTLSDDLANYFENFKTEFMSILQHKIYKPLNNKNTDEKNCEEIS